MSLKSKLAMAVVTSAAGAAMLAGGTFAYFDSGAQNTGNTFAAGTVKLSLDKPDATLYFNDSNMAPGDSDTQTITVSNDGTLNEYYTITAPTLTVKNSDGSTVAGFDNSSNGFYIVIKDHAGNIIYDSRNSGQTDYTKNFLLKAVGDTSPADASIPTSEQLTVTEGLDYTNAGDTYQGKKFLTDFNFTSVQAANNASITLSNTRS